jgi:hypothetical protein
MCWFVSLLSKKPTAVTTTLDSLDKVIFSLVVVVVLPKHKRKKKQVCSLNRSNFIAPLQRKTAFQSAAGVNYLTTESIGDVVEIRYDLVHS